MSYSSEVLADSPLLFVRFTETGGSTCANSGSLGGDASTSGANFTRNATALAEFTPGITVTGASTHVQYPDNASLDITANVTYEIWVKSYTPGTYKALLSKGANGYCLRINPSRQVEAVKSGVAVTLTSTGLVPDDGGWHHIVMTRSSNTYTIYIDGSSAGSGTDSSTISATAYPLFIGADNGGSGVAHQYVGSFDEAAVYNTALSAARILAHYNAGIGVVAPTAAFSGTPLTGDAPLSVSFTDASTNTPTSWAWDFGDGGTSTSQNPSHNYTVAGTYDVELVATNAGGSDTETKSAYVVVSVAALEGINLAPGDTALEATPSWERIDLTYTVQSWSIDRGREHEMSKTGTGTASIQLVDRNGDFDPTNTGGAFYDRLTTPTPQPMGPMVQAAISLQNPVTDVWTTLFRGFIASIQWVPYRSEQHANVTLELVDGLAFLAACEMAPNGDFGDGVDEGNIIFLEDEDLDAVQTRINTVLDQANWPSALRSVFTGNVGLQRTVYAPRSTVLSVIQDAADAEFPDIANVYISGPRGEVGDAPPGSLTFHGRYARFHPDTVDYDIRTWQLGDNAAADLDIDVVPASPPLVASLDDTLLYTSAISTPMDPEGDQDFTGQYVTNVTGAANKGLRTWSAENLLTAGGEDATTAIQETREFANYVTDNYSRPRVRVGQLTIKPRRLDHPNATAVWALLGNIDISDIVHLTTTHGGGGGFDDDFYVEGIHYQARPGGTIPYVELTLDVSPAGYYDDNPFAS